MLGRRKISSQVPHPTCQLRHVTSRCVTARGTYRYNAVLEPINRSNATPAMDAGYVDEMQNQLHPESYPSLPFDRHPPHLPCLHDFSRQLSRVLLCSKNLRQILSSRLLSTQIFSFPFFIIIHVDSRFPFGESIVQSVVRSFKYQGNIFVSSETDAFTTCLLKKSVSSR